MTYDTQTTTTTTSTIGGHDNSDEDLTNAIAITVASLATLCALACIRWRRNVRRPVRPQDPHSHNPDPEDLVDENGYVIMPASYMRNTGYLSSPESFVDPSPSPINEENDATLQRNAAFGQDPKNHDYDDPKSLNINKESNTNSESHDYEYVDPPALKGAASVSNDSRHLPRRHTTGNMIDDGEFKPLNQASNPNSIALNPKRRNGGSRQSLV